MTDPRERILEVALERMFEEERSDEAAERILVAWRRGVTGSGLEGLDPESGSPGPDQDSARNGDAGPGPRPMPHSARPELSIAARTWRAAAAVLLVGGALAIWASRESAPNGPHLLADRSVAVVDETGELRQARFVRVGQRVVVDGGQAVTFTWPEATAGQVDGGASRVVASDQTAFEWRPGELLLWDGELQVDAPTGPLEMDLRSARVSLLPGTSVVARVASGADDLAGADDALVESLALSVTSGSASMVYATMEPVLVAGEECELPGDPEEWWRDSGKPLAALCGELPRLGIAEQGFTPDSWLGLHLQFDRVAGEIVARLEKDPVTWAVLESRFRSGRGDEKMDYPGPFVSFLAWEQSNRALELARQIWIESPQSFTEEHLVAFASRGGFEFERELLALIQADPSELGSGLMAAAFFARRGDDVGRPLLSKLADLRRWEGKYGGMGGWVQSLLACGALRWLGDSEPWDELQDRLGEVIPAALEEGSVSYAGIMLAYADYFATEGPSVLTRVPMDVYLALHYEGLRERLDSARKVRDMIEDLAGRW